MNKKLEENDFNKQIHKEKEQTCKIADYKYEYCPYYCHCNNSGDEWHCIYECDLIFCPLIEK